MSKVNLWGVSADDLWDGYHTLRDVEPDGSKERDVVLATDFDALFADAERMYKALCHSVGITESRDAEIDAARGHFYERWLQEGK